MSGKTYTKGPWAVVTDSMGNPSVTTYRDGQEATHANASTYGATIVHGVGDFTENRTRWNKLENARLIAAAPDMLEALQGLLAIVDDTRGVDGYHLNGDIAEWDYFADDINAATAAVNKALGVDKND